MYEAKKALMGSRGNGSISMSALNRTLVDELDLTKPIVIVQFDAFDLVDFFLNFGHSDTKILIFTQDSKKYNQLKHLRSSRFDIIRNDIGALNSVMQHYHIEQIDLIISRYNFNKLEREESLKSFSNYYRLLSNHGRMVQVNNVTWKSRGFYTCTFDKVRSLLFWESMLPQISLVGIKYNT